MPTTECSHPELSAHNHPILEVQKTLNALLDRNPTIVFWQKFTCSKCGSRQTMAQENTLFKTGQCEECGHITNIWHDGCNYMLLTGVK